MSIVGPKETAVRVAWRDDAPDWVLALAREVDAGQKQASLAKRLGYCPAVISGVLKNDYRGNLAQVEARVRAALMSERVTCPALGEITGQECLEQQRKPLAPDSGWAVKLWQACQACPRNLQNKEGGA
ncbi:hypothetical protein [Desulfocurvibacter africanus]|uniref:hypothetical protein n=1 Tax=Desulfocurvibacter africanus TaxID=873 RepID=UPI0004236421|nr:hypothetical protein [Desulfocurvibacter africanus]